MQSRKGVGDPVLLEVIAHAHLAAEGITPVGDSHLSGGVRSRLDQDRHAQSGTLERLGDPALVAEIRQGDDDAVDLVAMPVEELRALARVLPRLDGAELCLPVRQHDDAVTRARQSANDLVMTRLREMVRKEAAIPDDHAEGLFGTQEFSFPGANFQQ
jgi:hypothetical protein